MDTTPQPSLARRIFVRWRPPVLAIAGAALFAVVVEGLPGGSRMVEVAVSGTAETATLTIASGGEITQTEVPVPFETEVSASGVISLNVQALDEFGTIHCQISSGEIVLSEATSAAAFGVAACATP